MSAPEIHGRVAPGFESLARELSRAIARRGGGAAVCAYYGGQPVVDVWGGVADETGRAWARDTMCVSYSTTKGVVATALHMLVDRGALDYDDRVADHWPEFAQAGKASITVRDVLSHRAGLFNVRDLVDDARCLLDWDQMVDLLARAEPARVPDGATAYHALTWGFLVGELIRRASGSPVSAFVRDEIAKPLGLDGLFVGAPASELHRAARLIGTDARKTDDQRAAAKRHPRRQRQAKIYQTVERVLRRFGHPVDFERGSSAIAPPGISRFDFSSDEVLAACIPAANGLFTARSLARLYAALANGGELDGVRLLSPRTLARATEIQHEGFDQITLFRMRWRLGYHRVHSLLGVPRRAFGHFGWGGSGAWADPTRNLSLGFIVNVGSGTPIGDTRILRLNTALLRGARARYRARRA